MHTDHESSTESPETAHQETAPQHTALTLIDVLRILLQHKKLIGLSTAIGALASIAFSVFSILLPPSISYLPNSYTAEAIVLLKSPSTNNAGSGSVAGLSGLAQLTGLSIGSETDQSSSLILSLIKQKTFKDQLIAEADFMNHFKKKDGPKTVVSFRAMIGSLLKAKYDEKSGLMTIRYTDKDKEFATAVLNRAVEILKSRFEEIAKGYTSEKMKIIEDSIQKAHSGLESSQRTFTDFQTKYGMYDLESSTSASVSQMQSALSQLTSLQVRYKSLSTYRSADDPQLIRLSQQIAQQQDLIKNLKNGSPELSAINVSMDKLPDVAANYMILKQELSIQLGIYASLRQQLESSRVEEGAGGKVFSIIEKAEVPLEKSGPSRGLICVCATFAVFLISVFASFAIEFGKRLSSDPESDAQLKELAAAVRWRKRA